MPSTQAYSVDWTVTIQPEGDVSADVSEIILTFERGRPDMAVVKLDTSERPHALDEYRDIHIELSDQNNTITFDGWTDSVSDSEDEPIVTIDSRESEGLLKDASAVGNIDRANLFQVIDGLVNDGASEVREISFDPTDLESEYGTFAGSTDFGNVNVAFFPFEGVDESTIDQHEIADREQEVELRIDRYVNESANTYTVDFDGRDNEGNLVTASLDLPPADDAQEAFGTDTVKLALSGGSEKWVKLTGVTDDISNTNGQDVSLRGSIWNYVKTNWNFSLDDETSVYEALDAIVANISGLDEAQDWQFYTNDSDELIVEPESVQIPNRHVFREGGNVLKPVARRNLDGVRNMVKVTGATNVHMWAWGYGGNLYWSYGDPFESGDFPNNTFSYASSPAPQNDIDQINLRGVALASQNITGNDQALDIAQNALDQYLRTPISGQAPVPGIHSAVPGDEAEIYYPSRGIPAKVDNNIYTIETVEYRITPETAKTTIDFGVSKRNMGDVISGSGRSDISRNIQQIGRAPGGGGDDTFPLVGTLVSKNEDGTWKIDGENGVTYDDVRVI